MTQYKAKFEQTSRQFYFGKTLAKMKASSSKFYTSFNNSLHNSAYGSRNETAGCDEHDA